MKGVVRLVRNGIDLVDRPQARDTRLVEDVHVDTAAQLEELSFWTYKKYRPRIWIPANLLVLQGAFRYQGGWNPLVEALNQGEDILRWYYHVFRRRSLEEMYLLPPNMPGADVSLWRMPWFGRDLVSQHAPQEKEEDKEHRERRGPKYIASHMRRLTQTRTSILKQGYQPNRYGDIQGCLLQRGGEGRFLVHSGKHRAAVLAAAGWVKIPVTFSLILPRSINETTAHSWPFVKSGIFDARTAVSIFNSYIDLDGTQQFSFSERVPQLG